MKNVLFAELLASVREGAAILGGEAQPSRTFRLDVSDQRQQGESSHKEEDER